MAFTATEAVVWPVSVSVSVRDRDAGQSPQVGKLSQGVRVTDWTTGRTEDHLVGGGVTTHSPPQSLLPAR